MKYTVDEIINNMVVLIDENGSKKDVSISILPCDIKENDVLEYSNAKYIKNNNVANDRKQIIMDKMAMLKKNND